MPSDLTDPADARPVSADLAWILLFVAVVVFALGGLLGWIRI